MVRNMGLYVKKSLKPLNVDRPKFSPKHVVNIVHIINEAPNLYLIIATT